jgi:hypothetical protein
VNKRKLTLLLTAFLCILLTGQVAAMSSANYRLDWFTPLTGSGGAASSANYALHVTVGQTTAGTSSSTGYEGCLGYWCGTEGGFRIYLPLTLKSPS